jgi:pimeloyl-ACP methyl ester carboxylesterase
MSEPKGRGEGRTGRWAEPPRRAERTVTSADGTVIVFDQSGVGPAVILVPGALMNRADPILSAVAAGLSRWFTVFSYDRRGRGDSGDTRPYAVEREAEDLAALIAAAGGSAAVFGGSSGAALALRAAVRNPAISRLALWEPPYHVDGTAPRLPHDFAEELDGLVSAGRPADALELFMVKAVQATPEAVAGMRAQPVWPAMEAAAQTLAYEALVMGQDNALPAALLARITQPTLVLSGGDSPAWMGRSAKAVAEAIPGAVHRVLEAQAHDVSPQAIVPELLEFFVAA